MSALVGKWKLVATDPLDELQKKIGTAEEWVQKSIALVQLDDKLAPREEIIIDGDKATLRLIISETRINDTTLTFGQETDGKALDGRPVKYLITKVSESKMTRIEKGPNYEMNYVREAEGDTMTVTVTGPDNCTVVRKYKKV